MARTVNGVSSILKGARLICRMVGRFGSSQLTTEVSPEFKAAVDLLVAACMAFEALDDYPGQVDQTAPYGVEDEELV